MSLIAPQPAHFTPDTTTMENNKMKKEKTEHSNASYRRTARQLVDMSDPKRKEMLKGFPSDLRCKIVEEMVNIRLTRMRDKETGLIRPPMAEESKR